MSLLGLLRRSLASTTEDRSAEEPSAASVAGLRHPEAVSDWVAIDIETTGLSPTSDRIVEIGLIRLDTSGREIDAWTTLIDPQRDMGATFVHGLETRHVRGAPKFSEVAPELLGRFGNARLVAHNARFDLGFLGAGFRRAGFDWGEPEAFCTMTIPSQLGVVANRRLAACCAELGITFGHEHTALGDARATGAILFGTMGRRDISRYQPLACPAWPMPDTLVSPRLRTDPPPPVVDAGLGPLAARVGVPGGLSVADEVALAYMALLDRVLEDRRLTEEEIAALTEAARLWGVGSEAAADIHRAYLAGVAELAVADGVITDAERSDLARLTELLGVGPAAHSRLLPIRHRPKSEAFVGQSVCFTGESVCTVNGVRLTRIDQERMAHEAGLVVLSGVSKKLNILVLSDPESQSGKARKADEIGVRKIGEMAFWRSLGAPVD